jgi:hypothetical protein
LRLKEQIDEALQRLDQPCLYQNGRQVGSLKELRFGLRCVDARLVLSFRASSTLIRRQICAMTRDSFGALALRTEWLGRPEVIEIRSAAGLARHGARKSARQKFQKLVEELIARSFPKVANLRSMIHSDLEHSISGKYVRLRFRSGRSEWHAMAVSPTEDQATIDGILSSGLIWREFLRSEFARTVDRLALIVPFDRLLVLKSRLAWIRGSGRNTQLIAMDSEKGWLSFEDLSDCGNLDTALSRVQNFDRAAQAGNRGAGWDSERELQVLVEQNIRLIDPSLDPRFVYPQVPAFLGGDRGMIDLLTVTNQGRLAVVELKVHEDIELPMQGLDYWLRVRWHQARQEFQRKGYFRGLELSSAPPLLFFACPQFRYHSSFPQVAGELDSTIPLIQVGINENWSSGVRVVLRRRLNCTSNALV